MSDEEAEDLSRDLLGMFWANVLGGMVAELLSFGLFVRFLFFGMPPSFPMVVIAFIANMAVLFLVDKLRAMIASVWHEYTKNFLQKYDG